MAVHQAEIVWKGVADEDFLAGHYSRAHVIRFDGGASVAGSASPAVVRAPWSDPAAVDPEELFLASLSSCHMLWFLDFTRRERIVVRGYVDRIEGTLGKDAGGAIAMTRVVLRPAADCDADLPTLKKLHERAHHACFIANSVKSEVVVEPRSHSDNQE